MSSSEESDVSPKPYTRGDSHKTLPHHDSLRELAEAEERSARRKMKKKQHDNEDSSSGSSSSSNNNHKAAVNEEVQIDVPAPMPEVDGGADVNKRGSGKLGGDTMSKKTNIIALNEIEIQQDQANKQNGIDPVVQPPEKKKKKKKLKTMLQRKPTVVESKPRQIYFNNPTKNASFGYPFQ
jgi:hypothetical protein